MSPHKPELLPLAQLREHPLNPRLFLDEGTVAAIEKSLRARGSFPAKHAISVRPTGGGLFEIVSGHQRFAAAKRAGLNEIYAFVEEMTDEEAYRELALSNNQRQLSPLEKAIHSLHVPLARGKKGKGLAAWADRVGLHPEALSLYRRGATVFVELRPSLSEVDLTRCLTLVEQLSAIGHPRIDKSRWPSLVRRCLDESWTIETAKAQTKAAGEAKAGGRGQPKNPEPNVGVKAPPTPSPDKSAPRGPLAAAPTVASNGQPGSGMGNTAKQGADGAKPGTAAASAEEAALLSRAAAYHEAGTAVMAFLQRRELHPMTHGRESFPTPPRKPRTRPVPADPYAFEKGIADDDAAARAQLQVDGVFWLSGYAAALRSLPLEPKGQADRLYYKVSRDDREYVESLVDELDGSVDSKSDYVLSLQSHATALLHTNWDAVEAVATALAKRGALSPDEARKLIQESLLTRTETRARRPKRP
jgi:ParB/RepB/Spo0J family partition protein